jgi:DNA (cytosine-5)-methyltransferase 1
MNNKKHSLFSFVDLFAGIGGFRVALENNGGICLGYSEIDKQAIHTYTQNFNKNNTDIALGNIEKIQSLPFKVDLLVGGVPCQSWSVAGKMKGFDDPRGRLWNDTVRLVNQSKPKAFIFENVKGLADPRNAKSLEFLVNAFIDCGYDVDQKVLNSYDYGVPQNRERIYIVGIKKNLKKNIISFEFPTPSFEGHSLFDLIEGVDKKTKSEPKKKLPISSIHKDGKIPYGRNRFQKIDELNDFFIFCDTRNGHTTIHSWDLINTTKKEKEICLSILKNRRKKIYGNSDGNSLSLSDLKKIFNDLKKEDLDTLVNKKILKQKDDKKYEFVNSKNSSGINGVYRVYLPRSNVFSTLTATGTRDFVAMKDIAGENAEDFKKNFISEIYKKKLFRPITSIEAAKLQGFPKNFKVHPKDSIAKKQFGNAVSVPVIDALIKELIKTKVFD